MNTELQILLTAARARIAQLRAHLAVAPDERERGALSIEMAILVGALVVIAGIIVAILVAKVKQKGSSIG